METLVKPLDTLRPQCLWQAAVLQISAFGFMVPYFYHFVKLF